VDVERTRRFVVKRPAALTFQGRGPTGEGVATYDGKSLTLVWPEHKAYARVRMPETLDRALDRMADRFNTPLPVGDLLYSRAYEVLVSPDSKGRYLGREPVGEVQCDHVAFTEESVDWELWVAVKGEPTPCRIRITTKGKSGALTSEVRFSEWNLSATPPAGAFEPQVPADYERIKVAAYDAPDAPTPAAPPASGKP
jgi:hypothetical protein